MQIMPAIDLLDSKVVRLSQGRQISAKSYSTDPMEVAQEFVQQGAKWLHVVDLNAAFGRGNNLTSISRLTKLPDIKVQIGGGIRTIERAKALIELGAERLVIGTGALSKEKLGEFTSAFGKATWVACDVRSGVLSVEGWTRKIQIAPGDFLKNLETYNIGGAIVTDVARDGLLQGASIDFFQQLRDKTCLTLYAAGGITELEDIRKLASIGYDGVILGRAIYEKKISLVDALELS